VASDCAERPAAAVLFRTRDADDLTDRVAGVLDSLEAHRDTLRGFAATENASSFIALYGALERKYGG
jgi:hypothetical protein